MSILNELQQINLLTMCLDEQRAKTSKLKERLKYFEKAEEDEGLIDALFWYFSELDIRVTRSIIKDVINIVTST